MDGLRRSLLALTLLAACGPRTPPVGDATGQSPQELSVIVTTERGPRGGRLVALSEDGTRVADLTAIEEEIAVDAHPSFSPDGRFLVFASTRERPIGATSLWLVEGRVGSTPRRLTDAAAVDRDPVFSPDGGAVVFSSSAGGTFDLWLLPLSRGDDGWPRPSAEMQRLTESDTDDLSPSVSPDGRSVVYAAYDRDSGRSILRRVDVGGGAPADVTSGPADFTPSYSPDGKAIAFAGPVRGRDDTDLFLVDAGGGNRRVLVDEPDADQTGPTWSADGRFVFATSVYRSQADGAPILSSVVVLDTGEQPAVLRALHDPVVVESRVGAAVARRPLDVDRLRGNPPYGPALRRALERRLDEEEFDHEERGRR